MAPKSAKRKIPGPLNAADVQIAVNTPNVEPPRKLFLNSHGRPSIQNRIGSREIENEQESPLPTYDLIQQPFSAGVCYLKRLYNLFNRLIHTIV